MDLSVVIVTWKGDGLLKDCLDSLRRVYGEELEIVVADNAAEESTRELVASYCFVKYVPVPGNPGFAGGNNRGLAATTRRFVLLLNNDTVVRGDSFSPLLEFLRTHPRAGIVQGTMEIPGFGLDDCGVDLTPVGIQRHLHRGEDPKTARLKPRRVFAAKGAMLLFRREVLADLGGVLFHDHFGSYYEETDFCHRARNAGWETWFVPTPPIVHLSGRTASRFRTEEIWAQYFRNVLWSFAHNFGLFGRLFTLPAFACAAFVRSPRAFAAAVGKLLTR